MPAPPGNTNALKHGLYAKRYTHEERRLLKHMDPTDLTFEIAQLRISANKIVGLLDQAPDDETKIKYQNALTHAFVSIATLARTLSLLTGTYSPLTEAIEAALAGIDPYLTD